MKKQLYIEKRECNSPRAHFNKSGDWRPRLIIWPEYNGLQHDVYEEKVGQPVPDEIAGEWGAILSGSLRGFSEELGLTCTAFDTGWRKRKCRIYETETKYKLLGIDGQLLSKSSPAKLEAAYFNMRARMGHDQVIFLLHHDPLPSAFVEASNLDELTFDRASLLPLGTAIFEHGIEEAVLEIALSECEDIFLRHLTKISQQFGYEIDLTCRHFLSHWIVVNKQTVIEEYGEDWNVF